MRILFSTCFLLTLFPKLYADPRSVSIRSLRFSNSGIELVPLVSVREIVEPEGLQEVEDIADAMMSRFFDDFGPA